jgi:hypothetical protein
LLANGKVLVAGGWKPGLTDTAEVYDPATATWTMTANLLSKARIALRVEALPDGRALAIGGWAGKAVDNVDIYDPISNRWTPVASLNTPRFNFATAILPTGQVVAVGGDKNMTEDGKDTVATAEIFDPVTAKWILLPGAMQQPRRDAALSVLSDGRLLVTGGRDDGMRLYSFVDIFIPGK